VPADLRRAARRNEQLGPSLGFFRAKRASPYIPSKRHIRKILKFSPLQGIATALPCPSTNPPSGHHNDRGRAMRTGLPPFEQTDGSCCMKTEKKSLGATLRHYARAVGAQLKKPAGEGQARRWLVFSTAAGSALAAAVASDADIIHGTPNTMVGPVGA